MKGDDFLKLKVVITSLISAFLIVIGLITFRLFTIFEDFSASNGLKAMITIWSGNDIAEFNGNKSEIVLMTKSNDVGKNTIISSLQERGYTVDEQMGAALMCEKNGEKISIISEMYTKHYIVYFLPNE